MSLFRRDPKPPSFSRGAGSRINIFAFVWRMSGYHQLALCTLALATAALAVVPLELQRRIVNRAIEGEDLDLLIVLIAAFLGVMLLGTLTKMAFGAYQTWLSESALVFCRSDLVRLELERRPHRTPEERQTAGANVAVIGSEMDQVCQFVGSGYAAPLADIALLTFALGYMIAVEPTIALVSMIFLLPQLVSVPLIQRPLNRLMRERTEKMRALSQRIIELEKAEAHDPAQFRAHLVALYGNRMASTLLKLLGKAIVNIFNNLAIISVLAVGGWLYIQGETSLGVIVAFMSGFERIAGPIRALVTYYRTTALKMQQYRKIAEWMS